MRIGNRQPQQMSVSSLPENSSRVRAGRVGRRDGSGGEQRGEDERDQSAPPARPVLTATRAHPDPGGGSSVTTKTRSRASTTLGTRSMAKRARTSGVSRYTGASSASSTAVQPSQAEARSLRGGEVDHALAVAGAAQRPGQAHLARVAGVEHDQAARERQVVEGIGGGARRDQHGAVGAVHGGGRDEGGVDRALAPLRWRPAAPRARRAARSGRAPGRAVLRDRGPRAGGWISSIDVGLGHGAHRARARPDRRARRQAPATRSQSGSARPATRATSPSGPVAISSGTTSASASRNGLGSITTSGGGSSPASSACTRRTKSFNDSSFATPRNTTRTPGWPAASAKISLSCASPSDDDTSTVILTVSCWNPRRRGGVGWRAINRRRRSTGAPHSWPRSRQASTTG